MTDRLKDYHAWTMCKDWILVRRDDPDEKTAGGVLLPDQAQEMKDTYCVLAIGPDVTLCAPGDYLTAQPFQSDPLQHFDAKGRIRYISEKNVVMLLLAKESE